MPSPLIGVTTSRTANQFGHPQFTVIEVYIQALSQAEASPILIPLGMSEDLLRGFIPRLDGILFTGGGDIEPRQYGSESHPKVSYVDPDRDRVELQLLEHVISSKMPFLGICRGIQLVNVALGGTLYVDIPSQLPGALKHDSGPDSPRDYLTHEVQVSEGSHLANILGSEQLQVNSTHHQGVRELAPVIKPVAFSSDGLVEAIELPGYTFGLAVQWHPEWLTAHAPMRALFRAFVQTAKVWRES